MPVHALPTPNPNAMKFTVGQSVGGPSTFVAGTSPENPMAGELLEIEGVSSIFMTADFVTITRTPEISWENITPEATRILEKHFDS
jgi:Scaffold protein Nfu/NifU N terminal